MENQDKINIRDIHQTFWRCRDFEITNLWQRSIFLTAFLVLCFTAYGTVLSQLIDHLDEKTPFLFLNIISYALALLGIIFSIMWIKMSKGSKAWYEIYESAIIAIEKDKRYNTSHAREIGGFSYNTLPKYRGLTIDNNIFSGKAGEYSVSRINIGIGQVFLVIWFIIGLAHIVTTSLKLHSINKLNGTDIVVSVVGIVILFGVTIFFGSSKTFKSSSIQWFESSNR